MVKDDEVWPDGRRISVCISSNFLLAFLDRSPTTGAMVLPAALWGLVWTFGHAFRPILGLTFDGLLACIDVHVVVRGKVLV